jgi:hypothetical protein
VSSLNPAQRGGPNITEFADRLAVYWTLTAADVAAELPNAVLRDLTPIGRGAAADRRHLHHNKAGPLLVLHKALGDDLHHNLIGAQPFPGGMPAGTLESCREEQNGEPLRRDHRL